MEQSPLYLPNLDHVVESALAFFGDYEVPRLNLSAFHMPLVVGSGNALNAGQAIFSKQAAIFADESTFRSVLSAYSEAIEKGMITQAVIISASGEKDSVWEIEEAKANKLETWLLTCEAVSSAAKIADHVLVYRKIAEPYTYNTSTYMGMLLSAENDEAADILSSLSSLHLPEKWAGYEAYAFVLPDEYAALVPMLEIKRHELFGPHLSVRATTAGQARHAKFVNRSEKELVIGLDGADISCFGFPEHRFEVRWPFKSQAAMMALGYWLIGRIQAAKPPYFKENIKAFCEDYGPKAYGKTQRFDIIVPGN
jgi:hypothetical protein